MAKKLYTKDGAFATLVKEYENGSVVLEKADGSRLMFTAEAFSEWSEVSDENTSNEPEETPDTNDTPAEEPKKKSSGKSNKTKRPKEEPYKRVQLVPDDIEDITFAQFVEGVNALGGCELRGEEKVFSVYRNGVRVMTYASDELTALPEIFLDSELSIDLSDYKWDASIDNFSAISTVRPDLSKDYARFLIAIPLINMRAYTA